MNEGTTKEDRKSEIVRMLGDTSLHISAKDLAKLETELEELS